MPVGEALSEMCLIFLEMCLIFLEMSLIFSEMSLIFLEMCLIFSEMSGFSFKVLPHFAEETQYGTHTFEARHAVVDTFEGKSHCYDTISLSRPGNSGTVPIGIGKGGKTMGVGRINPINIGGMIVLSLGRRQRGMSRLRPFTVLWATARLSQTL